MRMPYCTTVNLTVESFSGRLALLEKLSENMVTEPRIQPISFQLRFSVRSTAGWRTKHAKIAFGSPFRNAGPRVPRVCSLFPIPYSLFPSSSIPNLRPIQNGKHHQRDQRVSQRLQQFRKPTPFQIQAEQNAIDEQVKRAAQHRKQEVYDQSNGGIVHVDVDSQRCRQKPRNCLGNSIDADGVVA